VELHISTTQKKNYRQDTKAVKEWLDVTYPEIVRRAKDENAEIWWVDQTGARNASNYIKGYSPRGVTPTLPIASHHIGVNMISAITNKGKLRYHFYRGKFSQPLFIGFLMRLIKSGDKKVFAIVDNSTTHHGLLVRDWKEKQAEFITVFYLPSCSPELNPVEYLNNNLKRELLYKGYSISEDEVEKKVICIMRSIQSTKNRVASFFEHQDVIYAKSQE
jgi:transposase